jgi:hypothetical protein
MCLIGTLLAACAFQLHLAAGRAIDARRELLRESFEMSGGALLPDGWSSSHSRFLLWPDFVVAGGASTRGDHAAVADNVTGDAWLMSPPIAPAGCVGMEVRCRVRISDAEDAGIRLEVSPDQDAPRFFAVRLPLKSGSYTGHRVAVDVGGWKASPVAVRWCVQTGPGSRPVSVRIDEVTVLGLNERAWADRVTAESDTVSPGSIVVNEIMYAPRSGEPEWIELMNAGRGPVHIGGWTITDASGTRSSPLPAVVVPAGGTVVVTRDLQQFTLSRGAPQCDAVAPGSMPSLNNGGDAVIVRSASGVTIDSVAYAPVWGGAAGRSLERRDPCSSPEEENWGECEDSSGATPCAVNSIGILPVDVSVSLRAEYRVPHGTVALLDVSLKNSGREPVRDFVVRWFIDANRDAVPDGEEEVVVRREPGPILPGDSCTVTGEWTGARPGVHQLIVRADVGADERPGNNLARAPVIVGQQPGCVVINEIMYQPLSGESEYVELATASIPVEIDGWSLHLGIRDDGTPEKSLVLEGAGAQYVVVASDSSILERFGRLHDPSGQARLLVAGAALGLSNSGEAIRLVDPSGGTVDSVAYEPGWHDPAFTDVSGRSLEKIRPDLTGTARQSWSTSVAPEGGTPGMQNSIVAPVGRYASVLHVVPNPFSPDGDGREDHAVVSYRLAADAGYTIVRIFDVSGRLIRTLMERERGGYEGETVWDGRDDLSRRVRMGMYILHLDAFDGSGTLVATARTVVVVAGRL